jgi:hypothetical protein
LESWVDAADPGPAVVGAAKPANDLRGDVVDTVRVFGSRPTRHSAQANLGHAVAADWLRPFQSAVTDGGYLSRAKVRGKRFAPTEYFMIPLRRRLA